MTPITLPITGTVDSGFLSGLTSLGNAFQKIGEHLRAEAVSQALAANAAKIAERAYRDEAAALDKLRDGEIAAEKDRVKAANQAQVNVAGTRAATGAVREQSGAVVNSLRNIEAAQNAGLQALTEKAGQLAQSLGGITGQMADVAVKTVAGFGPMGVAITASVAALGFLLTAEQEHAAALARTRAISESTAGATSMLGASYASVAAAANAAATAEEARVAVAQQVQAIAAQQVTAIGAGFSRDEAVGLVSAYENVSNASRIAGTTVNRFTQAQVEHAISSGNMAEQMAVLGVAIEHSSNAAVEHSNVLRRAALANREAAHEAVAHAEAQTRSRDVNASSLGALQQLADSSRRLTTARTELTAATAAANVVDQHQLDIQQDLERARIAALRASDRARDRANEQAELDKHKAHIAPRTGGSTAAEVRAQEEALRAAQAANDNAGRTITFAAQQAEAMRVLAYATNEVRLAEAAARRGATTAAERQALTAALGAQTTAQERLHALHETEAAAARARAAALATETAAVEANTRAKAEAAFAMENGGGTARSRDALAQSNLAGKGAEQSRLNRLAQEHTFTGRLAELYRTQTNAAVAAADAVKAAFDGVGEALSTNIQLFVDGKATLSAALEGLASDAVRAVSKQAYAKGSYFAAEALGMLAIGNFPGAGLAAAASAGFFAAGALTGAAANAIAPSPPAASAAGAGAAGGALPDRTASSAAATGPAVVNNFYAPVIGGASGRTASEGESGMQINRLTDAERRRTRRAA